MFKNFIISALIFGAATLLLLSVGLSIGFFRGETGTLFIHINPFDTFRAADVHGGLGNILAVFGIMGAIIVINSFLAHVLYSRDHIFSYIFAGISVIIGILGVIFSAYIIAIN